MILKLVKVLGLDESGCRSVSEIDPDSTYVLTDDNLMKMMAIHMKFRYI